MSTSNTHKDSFKKFLNKLNNQKSFNKAGQPINQHTTQCGSGIKVCGTSGSCGGSCNCDDDDVECSDCSCEEKKTSKKKITDTVQDDGCFCRKCNTFLPMVEPDNKGDGKTICYSCANPW